MKVSIDTIFSGKDGIRQPYIANVQEITQFYDCLFRYCESGYVQFRCYWDKGEKRDRTPLQPWKSVTVTERDTLIATAVEVATAAANHQSRVVFCPPVVSFRVPCTGKDTGREEDVAEGVAISVEIDTASPVAALDKLTRILGVPTVILHSGGIYTNERGKPEDKLHLHWRLKEPTRTMDDYQVLKECRRLCALIANGDGSNVPPVHPVRWAGSWHRKAEPRLAWGEYHEHNEVELNEAYDLLREAAPPEQRDPTQKKSSDRAADPAELADVLSALDTIPNNDLPYEKWKEVGAAIWDGTGGCAGGLAAFHAFSEKSPKYDPKETELAWRQLTECPYTQITVGSLFHLAREADPSWRSPSYTRRRYQQWEQENRDAGYATTDEQSSQSDAKQDRTHTLIDELARLSVTDFYVRLPDAAKELGWKPKMVEDAVKHRRREIKDAERSAAARRSLTNPDEMRLDIGSGAEIAERIKEQMFEDGDLWVHTEGGYYHWTGTLWQLADDDVITQDFMLQFDGAVYGKNSRIKLNNTHVKSIHSFLSMRLEWKDFFVDKPPGVSLENGFVSFNDDGKHELLDHLPGQLNRHTLSGSYDADYIDLPHGSMFAKFLRTMFKADSEAEAKIKLIQEIAGCALIGANKSWIDQMKAIIMLGRSGNNGKSEILAILEALTGGCCSHVPADLLGKHRHAAALRGAVLNTCGELTTAQSIAGDVFKKAITNEILTGQVLYKDLFDFRPQALHVFATNKLPAFAGGIDKGCRRRLLIVEFLRHIPKEERTPDISKKIINGEFDLLVNWAIRGASRLIVQKGFSVPESSNEALDLWVRDVDAVVAWMRERVRETDDPPEPKGYKPTDAFDNFWRWAEANHYDMKFMPKLAEFSARMADHFPGCRRTSKSTRFRGITIFSTDVPDLAEDLARQQPHDDPLWSLMDRAETQYFGEGLR